MAETATTNITPWLNKAHPTRPTDADKDTLAKVMGGRVEPRLLYHKSKDTKRRRSGKTGSLAAVRSADWPLSSRTDALSTPSRRAFSTALRSDDVNDSLGRGDNGGAGLLRASTFSESFSGSDDDRRLAPFDLSQSLHTQQSPRIEPDFQSDEPFMETSRGALNFRNVPQNASDTQIMQTMGSSEKERSLSLSRKMRPPPRQSKVQTRSMGLGIVRSRQAADMRARQSPAMSFQNPRAVVGVPNDETPSPLSVTRAWRVEGQQWNYPREGKPQQVAAKDPSPEIDRTSESGTSEYHSKNEASSPIKYVNPYDVVRNEERMIVERHNKSLPVGAAVKYTISEDDTVDGRRWLQNKFLALQHQSATTFVLPKDWKSENLKASKGIRDRLTVE